MERCRTGGRDVDDISKRGWGRQQSDDDSPEEAPGQQGETGGDKPDEGWGHQDKDD